MGGHSLLETVLVALITLTNLTLIWIALSKSRENKLRKSLGTLLAFITIWIVSAFVSESLNGYSEKLLLSKIAYCAAGLGLASLVNLLNQMQVREVIGEKFLKITVFLPMVIISIVGITTNLLVSSLETVGNTFNIKFNGLLMPFVGLLVINFLLVSILVARGYYKSEGRQRRAYQVLLIGITLYAISNIVANVILPLYTGNQDYYRFGNYSVIFFTSLTSYAIIAHNLFEIRTLAAGVLAITINIILFAQIFLSNSTTEGALKLFIAIVVTIGSFSLVKNIQSEIKRREEVERLAKEKTETLTELEERNKNLATLQTISKLVLNEIEMKPMVQKILNEIPKRLEHSTGALLKLVKDGQLQAYAMSEVEPTVKVERLIGRTLSDFSYPIKREFNRLHEALVDKKSIDSSQLSDFISPPIARPVAISIQKLLGIHSCIAVPLFNGSESLGVLLLTFKVERDHLNQQDMEMIMAVADDVSLAIERAESYQKLKDANAYLSQLDKMKDEFISMASHELNTPLAAVEGYLSMILDEHMGKIDDKAKVYLGRAYDSSKRLAELILDLLNVSRIEQGRVKMKFSEANIYDLAESTVHELQVKVDDKKLTIKLEGTKSDKLKTWCDPDRIREVIVNLVGNAIKYTEKGGITLSVGEDNGKIIVKVTDTGRGIAQEDMNKLFQKFSQVKREIDEHQGTGLGLYISKNFVDLHKGRIWVESIVGKGSTFAFEIPVLHEAPKEVTGAILENIAAPKIEAGVKETPAIIAESSNGKI